MEDFHLERLAQDRLEGEGDMVSFNLSLYGMGDAAKNWTTEYTRALSELGFATGKAFPCNLYNKTRDLHLTVHGDDFAVSGPEQHLQRLAQNFQDRGR